MNKINEKVNHPIYNLLGIRYVVNNISKVLNCAKFEGKHLTKFKLQGIFANLNINSLLQVFYRYESLLDL